jgi:hypothetical protein
MAIERNFTGFEMADFGELNYGSGAVVSGALNTLPSDATARSGSRYYRLATATNAANLASMPAGSIVGTTGTVTSGHHKRVSVRAYCRIESHAQNGQLRMMGFGNDAGTCTVQFGAQNTSGGFLQPGTKIGLRIGSQSHNSGAVGAYPWGSVDLTVGVWYRYLLDIDLDVGATTVLTATLRVTEDSSNPAVDFTLTNTVNIGASDNIDKFAFGYSNNLIGGFARTATYNFDDVMYIATSDADAVSGQPTLPSQTHIYAIVPPNGAASNTGWSGTYADVDEYPMSSGDTMSSSTALAEVEFTHATGIALGYASLAAMKLYVNALVSGAGTGSVDFILNGTAKNVTVGVNYPVNVAADPVGGVFFGAMTPAAFSATTFGLKKQNGAQATVLANIGLEVIGELAAYGSGNQIRGETQIKAGSIYDAQIADGAAIQRHKIVGLGDGPLPIFFPEEEGRDDWMIPGPPGSAASVRIPVVPVFFPEDGEDAMLMAASSSSSSGGGSTTNNYNTYLGSQVLLAELTAAASTSLDFATRNIAGQSGALFQTDYDEYIVELINVLPATDNTDLLLRYSTDGGATFVTSAVYDFANLINNVANFQTPSVSGTGQTSSKIIPTQDNTAANGGACGSLKFFNPLSATQHKHVIGSVSWWNNDNQFYNGTLSFRFATTTAVNAFRMLYSSGNIASGVVRVYGLTKTAQSLQATPAHGLALLHTQTVAAAATLDIVSRNVGSLSGAIFQSDYDEYVIELVNVQVGTNDAGILGRVSTDGGATFSATTDARTFQYGAANNTTSGGGATGATSWDISGNQSNASTNCLVGFLKLYNPLSAALYKQLVGCVAWGHTGVDWISTEYSLIWKTITAINAFRLLPSSGTMTGTVRVYGVIKDATYPVSTIQTGTFASRPAVGNAGRIYLPNDGLSLGRDSGTAWETFGPLWPFTTPLDTGFSWLNQGTSTLTANKDALILVGTGTGNSPNIAARVKASPATPYTVTVRIEPGVINKNNHQYGIFLRQNGAGTGTGRYMCFFCGQSIVSTASPNLSLYIADLASATSAFGTFYLAVPVMEAVRWLRIADDGANTVFSVSGDGITWQQVLSQSRLTYLLQGPDQIGFFVGTQNVAVPNLDCLATILSWKQE